MTIAVSIENLHKKYNLRHTDNRGYGSLRDEIANTTRKIINKIKHPLANKPKKVEEFWALNGIDLDIHEGERIGIIGRNGAGKSTLLKTISRIVEPTKGRVTLYGRVSSLLEVGTGFHPELTGRENIFLNGAILGMSRLEINRKFDEIVYFAEIEKFLDTPVKHYSSGMYVRLAFAVAAHLEPEIFIIDEVLAVGDSRFQEKCLGKIKSIGSEGRTVIFVSHSMATISSLCTRGILLDKGKVEFDGKAPEAVMQYYSTSKNLINDKVESENVEFINANLTSDSHVIHLNETVQLSMEFRVKKVVDGLLVPNFHFFSQDGNCAFISTAPQIRKVKPGTYEAICTIPKNLLNEGTYSIDFAITTYLDNDSYRVEFVKKGGIIFNVVDLLDGDDRYSYKGPIPGALRPKLDWQVKLLSL